MPDTRATAPKGLWPIAKTVFQEFGKDHGTLMAASVAFYLLISLVPLVLVGIAIFGFFMTDPEAQSKVLDFAAGFTPGRSDLLTDMVISAKDARQELAGLGLIALLLTALGGISSLETAVNITWGSPDRHFLISKLFALGMFLLIGSLLVLTIGLSSAVAWARSVPGGSWLSNSWVGSTWALILPVLISSAMFTTIFKFFPNCKVDWKPAIISGLITATLWEGLKHAYQWYSESQFSNQEASYGVAAGFVGLVVWIYYSSSLVLLGSELTWVLQGCPGRALGADKDKEKDKEKDY